MPEFEQAAFSTPVGQTTGVIRTSYGFHIIHVEAKQQARMKPLDEVKVEIEPVPEAAEGCGAIAERSQHSAGPGATRVWTKRLRTEILYVTTTDFITQSDPVPGVGSCS